MLHRLAKVYGMLLHTWKSNTSSSHLTYPTAATAATPTSTASSATTTLKVNRKVYLIMLQSLTAGAFNVGETSYDIRFYDKNLPTAILNGKVEAVPNGFLPYSDVISVLNVINWSAVPTPACLNAKTWRHKRKIVGGTAYLLRPTSAFQSWSTA